MREANERGLEDARAGGRQTSEDSRAGGYEGTREAGRQGGSRQRGQAPSSLRVLKPDPMPAADRDGQPYRETDTRTSGTLVPTCASEAREGLADGG